MSNTTRDFEQAVAKLIGSNCWEITLGMRETYSVLLGFGEKSPRPKLLQNEKLEMDVRRFEPEISLMIKCTWRLESEDEVLCGCYDSATNWDGMKDSLQKVVGMNVDEAFRTTGPAHMRIAADTLDILVVLVE